MEQSSIILHNRSYTTSLKIHCDRQVFHISHFWIGGFPFNVTYFMLLGSKKKKRDMKKSDIKLFLCVCVVLICNFSLFHRTQQWKLPHKTTWFSAYFTVYFQLLEETLYNNQYIHLTWNLITRSASSLRHNLHLKRSFTGSEK